MKKPVFVDHTGRRRRAAIVLGSGLGVLLILGLVMLTAGLVSGAPVPLPGWPDAHKEQVAPTPGPEVAPSATSKDPKPVSTTGAPLPSTTATGPGNGNGNGHGRPTKTPGKP